MNSLLVVAWDDFEKKAVALDDARGEPGENDREILLLRRKVGRLRRLEGNPEGVDFFRLSELLLYPDTDTVMTCLPVLRRLTEDGTVSDDCDENVAAEFLRKFRPEEARNLPNPGEGLGMYGFGAQWAWLNGMLSDNPPERTERLLWLLERCGEEPLNALRFMVAHSGHLTALDLDSRAIPPLSWLRYKVFSGCWIHLNGYFSFAGCKFSDCKFKGWTGETFWGCAFKGKQKNVPKGAMIDDGNIWDREDEYF